MIAGYGTIVGLSCSSLLPLPFIHSLDGNYRMYVAMYGAVILLLACMDIRESKRLQQLMTVFRIVTLCIMAITIVVGMGSGGSAPWPEQSWVQHGSTALVPHAPACAHEAHSCPNRGYLQITTQQFISGIGGMNMRSLAQGFPIVLYSAL